MYIKEGFMKRTTLYQVLAVAVTAFGLLSCNDKLDEVPDNRTSIDTADKVQKLLTSGYPTETPAVICELSGDNYVDDNVVVPSTHNDARDKFHEEAYAWKDINNYSINSSDTPYQVWEAYYGGISVCNHAIEAMLAMSPDPATTPTCRTRGARPTCCVPICTSSC